MPFTDILPDPAHKINTAGQADAAGVGGPGYAAVSLRSKDDMVASNYNSMRSEKQSNSYHTWQIGITYNPLTCLEFHIIYAFLGFKRYALEPFYVSLPPYSSQTLIGMSLDSAATKRDETLEVDGTGAAPGMIFNIVGNPKVYQVTRVETNTQNDTAVGVGKERLHITPPIIEDTPTSTALNFVDVLFKVEQTSDQHSYSLNKDGLFEYSLSLEETP